MRLWHKDLIEVLPRQQLIAQWRECSSIAKKILTSGTPNHILVNKIMNYPIDNFITYCWLIRNEMTGRGYKTMNYVWEGIENLCKTEYAKIKGQWDEEPNFLFEGWHNNRYLKQCYNNLEEKYDCGGITEKEFKSIMEEFNELYSK